MDHFIIIMLCFVGTHIISAIVTSLVCRVILRNFLTLNYFRIYFVNFLVSASITYAVFLIYTLCGFFQKENQIVVIHITNCGTVLRREGPRVSFLQAIQKEKTNEI